jgi:FAM177 family
LLHLAADFCGEKLAWFFGITSPKYQYAIDEYYRRIEEVSNVFLQPLKLIDDLFYMFAVQR